MMYFIDKKSNKKRLQAHITTLKGTTDPRCTAQSALALTQRKKTFCQDLGTIFRNEPFNFIQP